MQASLKAVVVAATSTVNLRNTSTSFSFGGILVVSCFLTAAQAAVLPDDRADIMYHRYQGGGVTVDGPALLVRKDIVDKVSVSGSYYADSISSASIDVVTSASPYSEKRDEWGVGIDYARNDALINLSYLTSQESDYWADTLDVSLSQEVFGGMTTLGLGFSRSWDEVGRSDTSFRDIIDRYQYRLGLSQVLSKTWVVNVDYEGITDEGYLNNPYRYARVLDAFIPERYPRTHTSNALAVRAIKHLPWRASARADYRYSNDTWEVAAHTVDIAYNQYLKDRWLSEWRYRYYTQSAASFYSDNFKSEFNYMARDKELSEFASHTVGLKITYTLLDKDLAHIIDKASLHVGYDLMTFNYTNFSDIRNGQLYEFNAHIVQFIFSAWY